MGNTKKTMELSKNLRLFLIIFASMGSWSVYSLNSLRKVFYSNYLSFLEISNTQFGDLIAIWGIVSMICYLPGGILGDKVRMKYLAPLGLFLTALSILGFLAAPSYETMKLVYFAYGIATGLIFWSCRYKIIRMASINERDYSKNIGLGYGISSATGVIMSGVLVYFLAHIPGETGLISVLLMCAGVNFILAISGFIFIPKFESELAEKGSNAANSIKNYLSILKNPGVWLSSIAVFFIYSIYTAQYLTTVYLEDAFLASAIIVGITGTIRNYGINIAAQPMMGYLGRRFGICRIMLISCFVVIALILLMLMLPRTAALALPASILIIIYAFFLNGGYSIGSALLAECNTPENLFGTAVGVYSLIGFAPDVMIHPLIGRILDRYGNDAYDYIFILMIGCAICAIITLMILSVYIKKRKNQNP